jgi:hypothetical protein
MNEPQKFEVDMAKPKGVMHQVKVTVTDGTDGQFRFAPQSDVWHEHHGHFAFNKNDHHMRNHDYHLIEFQLDNRTGEQLTFPAEPHQAMWVARVENPERPICPDASTPSDYEVIEPICVCDAGHRLIVRNDNPRAEDWSFTLNLVKAAAEGSGKQDQVSWDPIIKNGGNGIS